MAGAFGLAGCSSDGGSGSGSAPASSSPSTTALSLTLDHTAWSYDEANDVY